MRKIDPIEAGRNMMLGEALYQAQQRGPEWTASVLRPTGCDRLSRLSIKQLSALCQSWGGTAGRPGVLPR